MDELENLESPWKKAAFELSLALAVVMLFLLIGLAAYRAVQEELQFQSRIGGELLTNCQGYYLIEVYTPDSEKIDTVLLEEYYQRHRDCKVFNVTDLDPLFLNSNVE